MCQRAINLNKFFFVFLFCSFGDAIQSYLPLADMLTDALGDFGPILNRVSRVMELVNAEIRTLPGQFSLHSTNVLCFIAFNFIIFKKYIVLHLLYFFPNSLLHIIEWEFLLKLE